ncbi:hypothetical protein GPAL_1598 [Glaciecola pallidula DSM 14239 = ACAM 615]|uniref:Uncharacterized protein n=1 Tax=Brumicola pallidula DSM 14239 = ACAM 615 TaxID=1121922 RepID=K6ZDQ2_9ALTE|nr:hypothetical protein GPAL_1598 [Glaciecola pallidula DSM 14239 = ACAM 615]
MLFIVFFRNGSMAAPAIGIPAMAVRTMTIAAITYAYS